MIKGDVTELDVFQYAGKPILPQKDSYSVTLQGGVTSSDVTGGLPKQMVMTTNAPYRVNATYSMLDGGMAAFVENFINLNRGQKFVAYLLIASGEIEPFVVQVAETAQISKTGFNGSISLSLDVEPAVDNCLVEWYHEYFQCQSAPDWKYICDATQFSVDNLPEAQL